MYVCMYVCVLIYVCTLVIHANILYLRRSKDMCVIRNTVNLHPHSPVTWLSLACAAPGVGGLGEGLICQASPDKAMSGLSDTS
jgi:hypothetical protein